MFFICLADGDEFWLLILSLLHVFFFHPIFLPFSPCLISFLLSFRSFPASSLSHHHLPSFLYPTSLNFPSYFTHSFHLLRFSYIIWQEKARSVYVLFFFLLLLLAKIFLPFHLSYFYFFLFISTFSDLLIALIFLSIEFELLPFFYLFFCSLMFFSFSCSLFTFSLYFHLSSPLIPLGISVH